LAFYDGHDEFLGIYPLSLYGLGYRWIHDRSYLGPIHTSP
jgi:hypothetical protein